jgi:hypothetical protein
MNPADYMIPHDELLLERLRVLPLWENEDFFCIPHGKSLRIVKRIDCEEASYVCSLRFDPRNRAIIISVNIGPAYLQGGLTRELPKGRLRAVWIQAIAADNCDDVFEGEQVSRNVTSGESAFDFGYGSNLISDMTSRVNQKVTTFLR